MASLVFPVPAGPERMRLRPSLTSSGPRKLPRSWSFTELWKVKSKSSMVPRKGNFAFRTEREIARLRAVRDLLGNQHRQVVAVAHLLALGALLQLA